ncbi:MAG: type II toxin-antitoxin system HicA family toxin [Dehalococcoidia bacterium]|nr:type II toxin-antitoxin system HicA family toxin [Dehalococcoidia bacterium]
MTNGGRRLRGISGARVLRALRKVGWQETDRTGKHVGLENRSYPGFKVMVPVHGARELKIKTLLNIIKQAQLTAEEFERLL